jgi:hypothetical protein
VQNVIFGGSADTALINVDNTISGAGQLGAGQMTLVNAGTILANGDHALVIDTGTNVVTNSGTLEATGSGGLVIESALANTGSLWADGGNITLHGDVTGAGSARISGTATLEFGAASDQHVNFAAGGDGTLRFDVSAGFTGSVSGFGAGDSLDLGDVAYGGVALITYAANDAGTGGTLLVSDGTHAAQITLAGQYSAAGMQADGQGGTRLAYDAPAVDHQMSGGIANDVLVAGGGNDLLAGGQGSDTLTGGLGADTFKWLLEDQGTTEIPAADTISDFGAGGTDRLDLRDLLVGEHDGTGSDANNLENYLHFETSGGTTTVNVSTTGAVGASHDQEIVMQGVDMSALGANDNAIISSLLAANKLIVDT